MSGTAISLLRQAFGEGLEDEALETLCSLARERTFAAGEVIMRQGDQGEALFVIIAGRATVTQVLEDEKELLLGSLGPGSLVGELALLDRAPRMATCRAVTAMTALEFSRDLFSHLMVTHPSAANAVLLNVVGNMRSQDRLIIEELSLKNEALSQAYSALQEAQAELLVKERLEHELALAAEAQRSLLPGALPSLPPYSFAGYQRPARQVGGDLYDVIRLDDDHVGLLLADVADKGLHAALIMAVGHTLFRTEARRSLSPAAVATAVHRGLLDLDRMQETFITAFYGVLHLPSGQLTYIRAAHEKPLRVRAGYPIETLEGGDRFLGMLPGLELREFRATLAEGDRLLMFSDGVPDATNRKGESYGYKRLHAACAGLAAAPVEALVQGLVADVTRWADGADMFDDLTLLAVATGEAEVESKGSVAPHAAAKDDGR